MCADYAGPAGNRADEELEAVALAKKFEDPNLALGEKDLIVETHHDYYLKYWVFKAACPA